MAAAVVHHKFAREPAFKKLPLQPGAANITVAELRQVLLEQTQVGSNCRYWHMIRIILVASWSAHQELN